MTPNGAFIYVANNGSSSVSVINTASQSVTATIPVGTNPWAVAVTPNGASVYVTNASDNTVSVIDAASNKVTKTIPVGTAPEAVVISPDGATACVVNNTNVSVINTATNAAVNTISVPPANPAASDGPGATLTPNGGTLYISIGSGDVGVVSTAQNAETGTISTTGHTVGSNLYYIALAPSGAFGYAALYGFNELAVFSTSTNALITTVPVGSGPTGVAVTPDGSYVYVANQTGNTVSVVSTATNMVVATVNVGSAPFAVAVTPGLDDDSQYALLSGGNTFNGNQAINGGVTATTFTGNGAGLLNINPAAIGPGTANINISGTASNAVTAQSAVSAQNAQTAANAAIAQSAVSLGGVPASAYARLDQPDNFSAPVSVSAPLTAGTLTIGGGTPIMQAISATFSISIPSLRAPANPCADIPVAMNSITPGLTDTIALGIPDAVMSAGGMLTFQPWESAANQITIRVCDIGPNGAAAGGVQGTIRVDVFKD